MNNIIKLSSICLVVNLMYGCTPSVSFTKTGSEKALTTKNNNCDFAVYATQPKKEFYELGVIEFTKSGFSQFGPQNITEAKSMSQEFVCKAGGNGLLLWEANGFGQYVKATVIKTL